MAKLDDRGLVDDGTDDLEIGGNLIVRGSTSITASTFSIVQKTAAYSIASNDYTVECTSGSFSLTLPTAADCLGKIYNLKNSHSGTITVVTSLNQTIDGQSNGQLSLNDCLTIQSNGSNWIIL